jgi:hypothetical protein
VAQSLRTGAQLALERWRVRDPLQDERHVYVFVVTVGSIRVHVPDYTERRGMFTVNQCCPLCLRAVAVLITSTVCLLSATGRGNFVAHPKSLLNR